MTVRVTAEDVQKIIETSKDTSVIEAFITAANLTIDTVLATAGLSEDQLTEIERWLAAHLMACSVEPQIMKEQAGNAAATYAGVTKMGLDATLYGQQVKILDTSGLLAAQEALIGKRNASVYAIPGPTRTYSTESTE